MTIKQLINKLTEAAEMTSLDAEVLIIDFETLKMHRVSTGGISVHPNGTHVTIHVSGNGWVGA